MSAPRRGPRLVTSVAGVASLATVASGCSFSGVYDLPLPGGESGRGGYIVVAEFTDVLDLVPKSSVKVADVTVGQVRKITLNDYVARVELRVKESVELPANSVAGINQTSLLGEKYVFLAPPTGETAQGRLKDKDVIPLARTGRNTEVEEVLGALSLLLNGGGVAQLKTINQELNKVMEGREDRIKSLLANLDTFIGSLDKQKAEIVRALEGVNGLARSLGSQRETIATALQKMPPALKILADQRKDLVDMLNALSDLGEVGARVIRQSKADTIADFKALQPTLEKLNRAGDNVPKSLEILVSYPFTDKTLSILKGDWSNLWATLDVNFQNFEQNQGGSPLPLGLGGGGGSPLPQLPSLPLPGLGGSSGSGSGGPAPIDPLLDLLGGGA